MLQHGINTFKDSTVAIAVQRAETGVPFFIGAAPCYTAKGYAGKPQYAESFAEAKEALGYSTEWRTEAGKPKWSLCQAIYAHFVLNAVSPAIFFNVFDPEKHKKEVSAEVFTVEEHTVRLPLEALDNGNLSVTAENLLEHGTDYETYYTETAFCIELLETGTSYSSESLTVAYDIADTEAITSEEIEAAIEAVEMCRSVVGIVPDLLCAPGWSSNPTVAAVMAAKAPSINGLFRAKAVVDLDSSSEGASDYSKVINQKTDNGYDSEDMIVCWAMVKSGVHLFDLSTVVCGLIASVDSSNDGCPYESPSNKAINITGAVNAEGEDINLTIPQADVVSVTDGVVTVINNDGWKLWGNYLGCYPSEKGKTTSDTGKMYICINRVQDWLCNCFVKTYWQYIDRPLTVVLRDAIVNSFNAWLNGLTSEGKLYGGEISYIPEYNAANELSDGKIRLDASAASPVPAQRIDMHIEYSTSMLEAAING